MPTNRAALSQKDDCKNKLNQGCGRAMGCEISYFSALSTAAMARVTSCSLVCQLHTDTRIQRCPRQVVPLKKASPVSAIRAITASVRLS